jgi:hypothetical protein
MDNSIFCSSPVSTHHRLYSTNDITSLNHSSARSTPFQIQSEKLRLSFEHKSLKFDVLKIKNRINKLLSAEQAAIKEVLQAKEIVNDTKNKKERNQKKLQEKEIKKKLIQEEQKMLREKVLYDRLKRMHNIQKLEETIVKDRQLIAKRLKDTEKLWRGEIERNKTTVAEEKHRKQSAIRLEMHRKKEARCRSEASNRKNIKEEFDLRVQTLRSEHQAVRKNLEQLLEKQNQVVGHVSEVLKTRDEKLKTFQQQLTL